MEVTSFNCPRMHENSPTSNIIRGYTPDPPLKGRAAERKGRFITPSANPGSATVSDVYADPGFADGAMNLPLRQFHSPSPDRSQNFWSTAGNQLNRVSEHYNRDLSLLKADALYEVKISGAAD